MRSLPSWVMPTRTPPGTSDRVRRPR
jgi:hypothetical protein